MDEFVLNVASTREVGPRGKPAKGDKSKRWTDRVKAKRVAKRKHQPSQDNASNAQEDAPTPPPTKKPRLDVENREKHTLPRPSQHSETPRGPTQIISSLFSYNPSVPEPEPSRPRPIAGPSNAPLKDASTFPDLGLEPLIVTHLHKKMGITAPTSIQRGVLSSMFDTKTSRDRDLFIQSQTGSGKTLAYLLPIIQDLLPLSSLSFIDRSIGTLAIIIAPTRELAKQISDVLESLLTLRLRPEAEDGQENDDDDAPASKRLTRWLVSGVLTGGATRTHEKARLRKGLPILVATPGRLLDHLQNTESFNVGKCRWLVLDEADRLMEMGFDETITGILKSLDGRRKLAAQAAAEGIGNDVGGWDWSIRRRTILCSATIQDDVEKLAGTALLQPILVKGSDLPVAPTDAVPGSAPVPERPAEPISKETLKFTPPAQLAQKYVTVPLKLRLVSLVALLRSIISQAPPPGRRNTTGGPRIIVFLSCTDSVDFHWKLLGGVNMSGEAQEAGEPMDDSEPEPDSDTPASPSKSKPGKAKPTAPEVAVQSSLLPGTSIYRLHGSLPLETRRASLKGFTTSAAEKDKHKDKATPPVSKKTAQTDSAILLCTSVASRGLDLPLVRAVVQYDLPTENGAAEYVHRVGRTARAGKGGEAWSFVAPSEADWVPWIEGNMAQDDSNGDVAKDKDGDRAVRLDPVGVQDVLKKGFGGGSSEFEERATQVQLAFEQWVLRSKESADLARRAFQSHMRAYATHPSSEKHIFHVRHLHTGHLAKAFALREAPSAMGSANNNNKAKTKEGAAGKKGKNNHSDRRRSDKEKDASDKKKSGGTKGHQERKKKDDSISYTDTNTASERMRQVVRTQGRLTKQGGVMGTSGLGEFQVAGGAALESLVHGGSRS